MRALGWLALAAAALLVPLGDPVRARLAVLRARHRLPAPVRHVRRRGRVSGRPRVPPALLSGPVIGAGVGMSVAIRAGPVIGVAAGVAAATGAHLLVGVARARAAERSSVALLGAVRLMAAELAAGAQPAAALDAAAGADAGRALLFAAAAEACRNGADVGEVLAGSRELRALGQAWTVAAQTGAPVAEVLERVAGDLDARRDAIRAVTSALAGPVSSSMVLALLPALGVGLGVTMDANPLRTLLGTPAGRLLTLVGVLLDVAGVFWTRRLARAAQLL